MRNLEGRSPLPGSLDRAYAMSIRRANLDAMAGKARGTIAKHVAEVKLMVINSERIRKTPNLPSRGPYPLNDMLGMGVAVDMLQRSVTSKGRIKEHIQFGTMRKVRSAYSKLWTSSPVGIAEGSSFAVRTGKVRMTSCPTQSEWFSDMLRGAEDRMGFDSEANRAVPIEVIVRVLELVKEEAETLPAASANELYKFGAYLVGLQVGSLRGYEGFYVDLAGLHKNLSRGREGVLPANPMKKGTVLDNAPHVVLCLMGKFKGET